MFIIHIGKDDQTANWIKEVIIMKNIPKCKECDFYKYATDNQGYGKQHHWCINLKAMSNKYSESRLVNANEYKTSPQWCPLRIKS
jgi:hypothetical protein